MLGFDFTQVSFLKKHRPVFDFGREWDPETYKEGEHTVESIREDMQQQTDWMSEVKFSLLSVMPYLSERLATLESRSVRIAKDKAVHAQLRRD
jgi:hypothetical protein